MDGKFRRAWALLASTALAVAMLATLAILSPAAANTYEKVNIGVTWDQARTLAAGAGVVCPPGMSSKGSHLATITSAAEQDKINTQLGNAIYFNWLGGQRIGEGPGWEWITGETWDYTNWQPGEPSGGVEDKLHVGGAGYPYRGTWNDVLGSRSFPYIIEYESCLYPFTGFFQPVDNSAMNVVKAGSAIPVKFSLGGNMGLDIFEAGFPSSVTIGCGTGEPLDPIETTVNAGASSLSYDAATGQYTYVWKTQKAWAGECRRFKLGLDDGSNKTFDLKLK